MTGMNDESPRPGIYPERGRSTLGSAWAIGLSIAMVLVTVLGIVALFFQPLATVGCSPTCDVELLRNAMLLNFVAAPMVTLAALFGVTVLRGRGRRVIIPAAVGLTLVIGLFAACYIATEIALQR